jgi:hypothetical protein
MMPALLLVFALVGDAPFVSARLVVDAADATDLETVDAVARACADVESTLGPPRRRKVVTVRIASDVAHFTRVTGRPGFEAAAFTKDTLWLTPKRTRGALFNLDEVYRHECVHAWLAAEANGPLPRVLEEAIALKLAGQAAHLPPAEPLTVLDIESAEATLAIPRDRLRYERTLARVSATFSSCVTSDSERLRALLAVGAHAERPLLALVGNGGPCSRTPSASGGEGPRDGASDAPLVRP